MNCPYLQVRSNDKGEATIGFFTKPSKQVASLSYKWDFCVKGKWTSPVSLQ